VVYISCTMATREICPDIYTRALGHGYIYQANPLWPWYNNNYTIGMGALPDIYMHLSEGKCVYIRQSTSAHGMTNMFYFMK